MKSILVICSTINRGGRFLLLVELDERSKMALVVNLNIKKFTTILYVCILLIT
jgi:hypothetical protein